MAFLRHARTVPAVLILVLGLSAPALGFIRGDANDDGTVNIADVIRILTGLFVPGTEPFPCLDAADANDSGAVDVADAIYLVSHLFVPGSPPPPAPFPGDGPDPTPDPLGDCSPGGTPLPFVTVGSGDFSAAPAQVSIIRDEAAWSSFWAIHGPPGSPPPIIDFSTEMVVIVIHHETSSGFFVVITELLAVAGGVEVHYEYNGPFGGCGVLPVLTQPHHIVRCPIAPGDPIPVLTPVDNCP